MMTGKCKDMDPDDVDIESLLPMSVDAILWDNVKQVSGVIGPDSSYKPLALLSFLSTCYDRLSSDRDQGNLISIYKDLLHKCHVRPPVQSSQPSSSSTVSSSPSPPQQQAGDEENKLYARSVAVRWILMRQMRRHKLPIERIDEAVTSAILTLTEDDIPSNLPLISLLSTGKFESEEVLTEVRLLLMRDPFLADIVIQQMNDLLSISYGRPVDKYDVLMTESLMHAISESGDAGHIMKLLHVLPESQLLAGNHALEQKLQQLADRLSLILSEEKVSNNNWSALFSSLVGRESLSLAHKLFEGRWKCMRRKDEMDEEPMFTSADQSFDSKNCILLALREGQHFMQQLLDKPIGSVDRLPRAFRLHHLLVKVYEHSRDRNLWRPYSDKLESLISTSHVLLSQDEFSETLVNKIKWSFDFAKWAVAQVSAGQSVDRQEEEQENEALASVKHQVLVQLFSCDAPLHVLSKTVILTKIPNPDSQSFDSLATDMERLLLEYGSVPESMMWQSFLCMRLSLNWLTSSPKEARDASTTGFDEVDGDSCSRGSDALSLQTMGSISDLEKEVNDSDSDLEEESIDLEYCSRIKSLLKLIRSLTLRTEVLENMFSFLFLTSENLQQQQQQQQKAKGKNSESKDNSSSGSTSGDIKFLARNDVVPKFLAFLKEVTFDTQTNVRTRIRRMQSPAEAMTTTSATAQPEAEYDPKISSIKSLAEAKGRLEVLLQAIHEGQWRYSVIEQSFHQEHSNNSSNNRNPQPASIMQSMLSSPQQLLRHSLTRGHVDQAKQVYKLFEPQLRGSEEYVQLRLSERLQDLADKVRLLISSGKRYHPNHSHHPGGSQFAGTGTHYAGHRTNIESTAKSMKIGQLNHLFSEFIGEAKVITGSTEVPHILLTDYGLTRAPSLEVSQVAIETGMTGIDGKNPKNSKISDFLTKVVSLIVVAKNSLTSDVPDLTLPHLMSFNTSVTLFSNPSALIEESLKRKKLTECMEDIRSMIKGPQEEAEQQEFSGSHSHPYGRGSGISSSSDGKKLVLLFQKLLRLCPPGQNNYLKGLFYHVRRVSRTLNECRDRSRSHSSASGHRIRSSISGPSSPGRLTSSSYFSVLYQSPSAILCQMVLKEGVPPPLVHDLSQEMKVDLIGTLCSILCPPIKVIVSDPADELQGTEFNLISSSYPALCDLIESFLSGSIRKMLSRQETESSILIENHFKPDLPQEEENTYDQEHNRAIISKPELIMYFRKQSELLVEVLRLLKLIDERKVRIFESDLLISKVTPLGKYLLMIRKLFANGAENNDTGLVSIALSPNIRLMDNSIIMKSLEVYAEQQDLHSMITILRLGKSFSHTMYNSSLDSLQTAVLSKLTARETDGLSFLLQIESPKTQVDLLIENIDLSKESDSVFTDSHFCLHCIDAVLGSVNDISNNSSNNAATGRTSDRQTLVTRLTRKQQELKCFSRIAGLAGLKTWVHAVQSLTQADILTILKTKKQYALALEWNHLLTTGSPELLDEASTDPQIEELRSELLLLSYAEREMDDELAKLVPNILTVNPHLVIKSLSQVDSWHMKELIVRIALNMDAGIESRLTYSQYLLGLQLIQLLPLSTRQHYVHLISKPHLLIEQMLMNTEYQALEQALKIKCLMNADDLIEVYSRKAVDIKLSGDENSSYNGSDYTCISSSVMPQDSISNFAPSVIGQPSSVVAGDRAGIRNNNENNNHSTAGSVVVNNGGVNGSNFFPVPMSVPTRDQWVPDHKVQYCMVCKIEKFSVIFNRKHHCRRCGRVVCHSCSDRYVVIPDHTITSPVRVCLTCFSHMRGVSSEGPVTHVLRKDSFSSVASSLSVCQWILSLDEEQNSMTRSEFYYDAAPSASLCLSILKLHTNLCSCIHMILDQMIRSLVDVLTSNQVDYGLILNIMKALLVSVKVIIETHESPELRPKIEFVDNMLSRVDIVNMLVQQNCLNRDLINSVISVDGGSSASSSGGNAVAAGGGHHHQQQSSSSQSQSQSQQQNPNPSNNQQFFLLRLMEKLLEMERFELALNICKKYGCCDVKGIWKTWAVICLKNGKLAEARLKFKHVMDEQSSSSGGNSSNNNSSNNSTNNTSNNSKTLQAIFDVFADDRINIRLNQRTGLKDRVQQIRKGRLNQLVSKESMRSSSTSDSGLLPQYLLDESLYYLRHYGGKEDVIRFYSRFALWKPGLEIFLSEGNPSALTQCFVSDFLMAAMKRSSFSKVLSLLKSADPTLSKSWRYLIAGCKHFSKHGYYNVLHVLQLFMGDLIRAGITQVFQFFLCKPYHNYGDLYTRLDHLILAKSHFSSFLENYGHHSGKGTNSSSGAYLLMPTPVQVRKNVRTIDQQIEITRIFQERGIDGFLPLNFDSVSTELATPEAESPNSSFSASMTASGIFSPAVTTTSSGKSESSHKLKNITGSSSSSYPLTLFDDSRARKTQLAALICVESGNRISDGFSRCHQLITEYKLDPALVYRLAGRVILATKKAFVIDRLNQLLSCIRSSSSDNEDGISESLCDGVTGACVRACTYPDLLEPMIKLLISDINRIDCYILCGKLRSAYLLAVRLDRMTDVRRIAAAAERTGQEVVRNWCIQWLQRNQETSPASTTTATATIAGPSSR